MAQSTTIKKRSGNSYQQNTSHGKARLLSGRMTNRNPYVSINQAPTSQISRILTPSHVFTTEKLRGALSSIFSGGIASGLNFAGIALGLSPGLSTLLAIYIIGNLLTYIFDIMFAKKTFKSRDGGLEDVPYSAVEFRFRWLLHSILQKQFFRFIISVIIDTLLGIAVIYTTIEIMDENEFLNEGNARIYRDFAVSSVVTLGTFFLFVNVIRFDWAYNDKDDPEDHVMNIVVLAWLGISMMLFAIFIRPMMKERARMRVQHKRNKQNKSEGPSEELSSFPI